MLIFDAPFDTFFAKEAAPLPAADNPLLVADATAAAPLPAATNPLPVADATATAPLAKPAKPLPTPDTTEPIPPPNSFQLCLRFLRLLRLLPKEARLLRRLPN